MISTLRNMRGTAVKFAAALVLAILLFAGNAFADCQGEFTPMADSGSPFQRVHFFPKNGNQILIDGVSETIPPGVGVISGGVIGTYDNASIDKVTGQHLAGHTLYFVYAYMLSGSMVLDFSQTGHEEDATYGNEVRVGDPARSLVGMVYTDANGRFVGSNRSQLTLSWFNRGHTGLMQFVDGDSTSSSSLAEVNSNHRLEWLQWGINNTFRQGFTVPNIYVTGTVVNSAANCYVQVGIGIDGSARVSPIGSHFQASLSDAGTVATAMVGANGANEGYHYATFLMGNGGSCGTATITSGAIYSSPLES